MAEAGREGELGGPGRWFALLHGELIALDPEVDDPYVEQNRHMADIMP